LVGSTGKGLLKKSSLLLVKAMTPHLALLVVVLAALSSLGASGDDDNAACREFPLTCHEQFKNTKGLLDFDRFLVVVAHPDDAATCAGGTVAVLAKEHGKTVRYVVMTSGDKGTSNHSMSSRELAAIRRQEQLNAAAVLGVASVDFFDVSDGELVDTMEIRGRLTRLVRTYKPQVILTWDPLHDVSLYNYYLEHRDHRASGQIALDVAYPTARDFLYFPEQFFEEHLEPWDVEQVYLFSWRWWPAPPGSNYVVNISGSGMELKIKSMLEHKSQVGKNVQGEIEYLENMGRALAQVSPHANISSTGPTRSRVSRGSFEYAEWFKRVLFPGNSA
jgi:LmbE family N-acetylglucosaminyl deacetylase